MTAAWTFGEAPADAPLTYPGTPPPGDTLLIGRDLYPMGSAGGQADIGWWHVSYGGRSALLDDVLAANDAPLMAGRTPVLAVGSNRSPAQIAKKLAEPARPALSVVPLTRVRVNGLGVGHSAHIGKWGYIPCVPVARPGWHDQWLTWLDPVQLEIVNATEVNYRLVSAPFPLLLTADDSTEVGRWLFYRGKWGALCLPPDAHGPSQSMAQHEAYLRLLAIRWFRDLLGVYLPAGVPELVTLLREHEGLRERVRDEFPGHGCRVGDGLDDDDVHPS